MGRAGIRRTAALASILSMLTAIQVSSQEPTKTRRFPGPDPAVTVFTALVVGKEISYPADRERVVAALDGLASAIEGLGLARNVLTDAELGTLHQLRRDIRSLGHAADTPSLTRARAGTFVTVANLLDRLDRAVPRSSSDRALVTSLHLSADGLDRDYPLKWQPNAMENFFDFAAKLVQQLDDR